MYRMPKNLLHGFILHWIYGGLELVPIYLYAIQHKLFICEFMCSRLCVGVNAFALLPQFAVTTYAFHSHIHSHFVYSICLSTNSKLTYIPLSRLWK